MNTLFCYCSDTVNTINNIFNSSISISIPRRVIATLLASYYILAFVMCPYWSLIPIEAGAIKILSAIIGLGVVWSYLSAGDIQTNSGVKTLLFLGVLLVGMAALNYGTLTSVIPWRGDESTFIVRTRDLMSRVPIMVALLAPIVLAFIVYAVVRKSLWLIFGGVFIEACVLYQFFQNGPFNGIGAVVLLRWPYVNYWFYIIAPYIAKYIWNPNHEFLYRIIPLVAAAGLVWVVQRNLRGTSFFINLLWLFSIATIPIVFYYSSILYIELSAVFLMLIVCFHANDLLQNDFNKIKRSPGWLALVLMGFVKETVIVFLLCFLVCRTVISWQSLIKKTNKRLTDKIKNYLMNELPIFFCILYPYMLYMAFRAYLTDIRSYTRTYSPNISNLLNPNLYKITGRSFIEQFGIFLPFFFWGLFLLLKRKDYLVVTFTLLLFIGVSFFYGIDSESQGFIGYSRFNLFVLPPLLVGSVAAINQISKWGKTASAAVACLAIVANLAISPVNFDGTKKPNWGNYLIDTSEHYYPYDQALLWLKNNHGSQRILFSEMYYQYYLSFYFAKFNWHPTYTIRLFDENSDETVDLSKVMSEAEQEGYNLVLYQVGGNNVPQSNTIEGFCLDKVFKNQAHMLMLYSRMPNCNEISK